jgi:hypothetical protein
MQRRVDAEVKPFEDPADNSCFYTYVICVLVWRGLEGRASKQFDVLHNIMVLLKQHHVDERILYTWNENDGEFTNQDLSWSCCIS